jgi:hypothetical protein
MFRIFLVLFAASVLVLGSSGAVLAQIQEVENQFGRISFTPLPFDDDDDDDDDDNDNGFADDVAGSYYLDGTLTLLPDGPELPLFGLQTYHKDGTLVTTDSASFLDPAMPQSPGHGSWIRTGDSQVTNTAYIFLFGTFGGLCDNTAPNPPNPFCLIAVPVGPVDFDSDFKTGQMTFQTMIWPAGSNPASDPPLVPFPTAEGQANLTRIEVPEP